MKYKDNIELSNPDIVFSLEKKTQLCEKKKKDKEQSPSKKEEVSFWFIYGRLHRRKTRYGDLRKHQYIFIPVFVVK